MVAPIALTYDFRLTALDFDFEAQPVWLDTPPHSVYQLFGWRIYTELTPAPTGQASAGVRLELGGGQVAAEDATARLLTLQNITAATDGVSPIDQTGSDNPALQWKAPTAGLTRTVWQNWPGCYSCIPVFCDDTVRLFLRNQGPGPAPVSRSLDARVTLWVAPLEQCKC